jgi:tRNA (adenine22-N1)-methyltransferase
MAKKTATLVDVGAGDGIIAKAIADKLNIHILAIENKKNSFALLADNVKNHPLIHAVFGDGLNINANYSAVLIAGMGGNTMVDILTPHIIKLRELDYLLLSPHTNLAYLKKFMFDHQFSIKQIKMVNDHQKYYFIYLFVPAAKLVNYDISDLYIEHPLLSDPLYSKYLSLRYESLKKHQDFFARDGEKMIELEILERYKA